MEFEGSTALHPRVPKSLLLQNGKPKGPFSIRSNAYEFADMMNKVVPDAWRVTKDGKYVVPSNMDDDFNETK
jgi:hypothetical protein